VVKHSASNLLPVCTERADLNALLAVANLLRMRGQWVEAIERCTEALRLCPESAAAHSLIADIYENQGRLDKAIHWYQLALELAPESLADKAKLARARELQAVRRRSIDPRLSWAYLLAVAGVAFLFVAFIMAAIVAKDRGGAVPSAVQNIPLPAYPQASPPRVRPPDHTTEEDDLARFLIDELHSSFMRVSGVLTDPLNKAVTVTVAMEDRKIMPDPAGGGRRGRVMREGYRVAYLTLQYERRLQQDLRYVTVRAIANQSSGSGAVTSEEVWRGRIETPRLVLADDKASAGEVASVFEPDMYWNPVVGL
jgi:hypothetical protein